MTISLPHPPRLRAHNSDRSAEAAAAHPHTADGHLVEPQSESFKHARKMPLDPEWYKRAVF